MRRGFAVVFAGLATVLAAASAHAQVSAVLAASRTGGAAPLAVFFDATATTCTSCGQPFHDLSYEWDFGDPGSGAWGPTGKPRNEATGPVAAHVFEAPGTHPVTLRVYDANGLADTESVSVVVDDPEVVWAGTATRCFSTSGSFTGCPPGATRKVSSNLRAALGDCANPARRCLFRRGEVFTSDLDVRLGMGPGLVGGFGPAHDGLPILKSSSDRSIFDFEEGSGDWRIVDVLFEGKSRYEPTNSAVSSNHRLQDLLVLRTRNVPGSLSSAVQLAGNILDIRGQDIHRGVFLVDNVWHRAGVLGVHVFAAAAQLALLGNDMDDSQEGEHVVRVQHAEGLVISSNRFARQAQGKALVTIRSRNQAGTCSAGCGRPTRDAVISDNEFFSNEDSCLTFTPSNRSSSVPRGEDFLIERNFFTRSPIGEQFGVQLGISATNTHRVTVRNNLFDMTGWQTHRGMKVDVFETLRAQNNSCWTPDNPGHTVVCVDVDLQAGAATVLNNVLFAPAAVAAEVVAGLASVDPSNRLEVTTPFVSATPSAPPDYAPAAGSVLIDAGAGVGADRRDYGLLGRVAGAAPDVGAWEFGSSPPP